MTLACSPTSMQAAVSSLKFGLKLNPSFTKNALLRSRSATGRFTNSMRPGCAGVVMVGRPARPAKLIGGFAVSAHDVGALADLLHDQMARMALDDAFDVGTLMFGQDGEPAAVLAQMRVVVDREGDACGAFRVAALAGEIGVGVQLGPHRADLVV